MQRDQLWRGLKQHNFTSQEACPDDPFLADDDDWITRVLQGVGGWFAAVFLLVSVSVLAFPIIEHPRLCGLLGLSMNLSAFHYYWLHKKSSGSYFLKQLFLVLSLAGQALVTYAVTDLMGWQHEALFWVLALYQFVLVLVMHDYVHRLMSALFAVTLIFWGHSLLLSTGVGSALLALAVVWLWLDKVGWQAEKIFYEPLAYAAALSLVGLNLQALSWYWQLGNQADGWLLAHGEFISGLLHIAAFGFFYRRLQQKDLLPQNRRDRLLMALVLFGLGILGFVIPGLSGAVLLLMLGFGVCQSQLMVLGVVSMLGFVSWYYYQMDTTLLNKAMLLAVLGSLLLLAAWLGRRPVGVLPVLREKSAGGRIGVLVLTVLVTLLVVNAGIVQKQRLIQYGDLVFFELAPVDPRSLMQGDYMRLRFALANQIQASVRSEAEDSLPRFPNQGIITADDRRVVQWQGFYRGQDLQADQYLLDLRWQGQQVRLATDAYFFEEGSAKTFEQAQYGGFRMNTSGDAVLVGLYDADLKLLIHSPTPADN